MKNIIKLILLNTKGHTTGDPWMSVSQQQQKRFWTTKKLRGFQATDSLVLTSTGGILAAFHTVLSHHPCSHCSPFCLGWLHGSPKKETEPKYAFAKHFKRWFRIGLNPYWLREAIHWEMKENYGQVPKLLYPTPHPLPTFTMAKNTPNMLL